MKKYIVFAMSFLCLFAAFQIVSGYLLTIFYVPDITSAWNQAGPLTNNTVIKGGTPSLTLFIAFFAATLAYLTSKLFVKDTPR